MREIDMYKKVLLVKNIAKKFGGLMALEDVSFEVYDQEIVGIIGPNGAGKTTLFNVISGIHKPDSGEILFRGENLVGLKPHQICKRGIARTFQVERLIKGLSVLENVTIGAAFGGSMTIDQAQKEAKKWLKFVGIMNINRTVAELTSAERKILEIARALATKPKIMLIDEVLAGLNLKEILDVVELIKKCKTELGITILWIEHVMKAIMKTADRIVVLHNGRKICEGIPMEIANNEKVIEAYLGRRYA